jgi:hypothetical protein
MIVQARLTAVKDTMFLVYLHQHESFFSSIRISGCRVHQIAWYWQKNGIEIGLAFA